MGHLEKLRLQIEEALRRRDALREWNQDKLLLEGRKPKDYLRKNHPIVVPVPKSMELYHYTTLRNFVGIVEDGLRFKYSTGLQGRDIYASTLAGFSPLYVSCTTNPSFWGGFPGIEHWNNETKYNSIDARIPKGQAEWRLVRLTLDVRAIDRNQNLRLQWEDYHDRAPYDLEVRIHPPRSDNPSQFYVSLAHILKSVTILNCPADGVELNTSVKESISTLESKYSIPVKILTLKDKWSKYDSSEPLDIVKLSSVSNLGSSELNKTRTGAVNPEGRLQVTSLSRVEFSNKRYPKQVLKEKIDVDDPYFERFLKACALCTAELGANPTFTLPKNIPGVDTKAVNARFESFESLAKRSYTKLFDNRDLGTVGMKGSTPTLASILSSGAQSGFCRILHNKYNLPELEYYVTIFSLLENPGLGDVTPESAVKRFWNKETTVKSLKNKISSDDKKALQGQGSDFKGRKEIAKDLERVVEKQIDGKKYIQQGVFNEKSPQLNVGDVIDYDQGNWRVTRILADKVDLFEIKRKVARTGVRLSKLNGCPIFRLKQ